MIFQTESTAAAIPWTAVVTGRVNPTLVPPVPPAGVGWYTFTWAMHDQAFTCVHLGGVPCLGWVWQRRIG